MPQHSSRNVAQASLPVNLHIQPCLMLVTQPMPGLARVVADAVAGGVDIVQWRDYSSPPEDLIAMAREMRAAVPSPALLVVNGNIELAKMCHADGVHLGEHATSINDIRTQFGEAPIIGRSVHSIEAACSAANEGADYLVAGTIFASKSHPDRAPAGLDFLRAVCEAVDIPVIAIGGLTIENAKACLDAGVAGIAVLSPIMGAADPRSVAREYKRAITQRVS